MKKKKFIVTAFLILASISLTVAFQVYWNVKNYQENKRQLISELQSVLDQSVDEYFNATAEKNIEFLKKEGRLGRALPDTSINGRLRLNSFMRSKNGIRNMNPDNIESISILADTFNAYDPHEVYGERRTITIIETTDSSYNTSDGSVAFKKNLISGDSKNSINLNAIRDLTSKIIVTIREDSLDLSRLDSIFSEQLDRRSIPLKYTIYQADNNVDKRFKKKDEKVANGKNVIKASSPFITGGNVKVKYNDLTYNIVRRSLAGISISFLITLFIALVLLYLYQIIKNQKEIALIKDDLINNITHELKTPIATALTAVEGIRAFNTKNDPQKTEKYLNIGTTQLNKLSEMVEKLLETATLDNNSLRLKKERADITALIKKIKSRFDLLTDKQIDLESPAGIEAEIDPFHFENAVTNLIDNAIKYGGETIKIKAFENQNVMTLEVIDTGGNIPSSQAKKVFEKFYRISTGNVHNVKGFGIGLYYTKQVIVQHGGKIDLEVGKASTKFTIEL